MTIAQHYRYKRDTLYWTPDGTTDAVLIKGVQSLRFGEGGETTELTSDASEFVEEIPLSKIKGRLSVTALAQVGILNLRLGAGSLTFDIEQVKNGRGAVDGEDQTVTFAVCSIEDKDAGVGSSPGESASLSIKAVADDDGNIFTVESAA